MLLYPEETCVMCDLPWKNNRVCCKDSRELLYEPRVIRSGGIEIRMDLDGMIHIGDQHIATGLAPLEETMALDTLHRILYFAAENGLAAYSLEEKRTVFMYEGCGSVGAPLLFEWLQPDGTLVTAVGFCDGAQRYRVLERVSGALLWCTDILGQIQGGAASFDGCIYMALSGCPHQVLCLDARNGDAIWWNRGEDRAIGGVVCEGCYQVLTESGRWHRYALWDGEKLK